MIEQFIFVDIHSNIVFISRFEKYYVWKITIKNDFKIMSLVWIIKNLVRESFTTQSLTIKYIDMRLIDVEVKMKVNDLNYRLNRHLREINKILIYLFQVVDLNQRNIIVDMTNSTSLKYWIAIVDRFKKSNSFFLTNNIFDFIDQSSTLQDVDLFVKIVKKVQNQLFIMNVDFKIIVFVLC